MSRCLTERSLEKRTRPTIPPASVLQPHVDAFEAKLLESFSEWTMKDGAEEAIDTLNVVLLDQLQEFEARVAAKWS